MTDTNSSTAWVGVVADAIAGTLGALGLRRVGKTKFCQTTREIERRFLLTERRPRYGDDRNAVYIGPVVHVVFPDVCRLRAKLADEKPDFRFPTIGGSTGLYGPSGALIEFGIAEHAECPAVAERVINEIRTAAIPFWQKFDSLDSVLRAADEADPWIPREPSWILDLIAISFLARGAETARATLLARERDLGTRARTIAARLESEGRG